MTEIESRNHDGYPKQVSGSQRSGQSVAEDKDTDSKDHLKVKPEE